MVSKTAAVTDADKTADEWVKIKPLVVNAGYPRDRMVPLWNLINKHHKDEFPNLITLAHLALTAPIHNSRLRATVQSSE